MIGTRALVIRAMESGTPDARFYSLTSRDAASVTPSSQPIPEIRNFSVVNGRAQVVVEFPLSESELDHMMLYSYGKLNSGTLTQHDEQGRIQVTLRGASTTLTPRALFELTSPGQNITDGCPTSLLAGQCSDRAIGKRDVQITHGVLMFIIWSFNITVGVFVARYERHTAWWLQVHKFLQLLCTITTIPVYVIGFIAAESETHFSTMHGKLGLSIAIISSLQVSSGVFMYKVSKLSR